jgi:hypothetical protein
MAIVPERRPARKNATRLAYDARRRLSALEGGTTVARWSLSFLCLALPAAVSRLYDIGAF